MIRGVTATVVRPTATTAKDRFGNVVYGTTTDTVDNVLVSPSSSMAATASWYSSIGTSVSFLYSVERRPAACACARKSALVAGRIPANWSAMLW